MTVMEPKLAERRRGVSEDRARGRLKWVLVILVVLLAVVGGAWLIKSPALSIRTVTITGASMSNPAVVVDELAMGRGTPTIDVDGGAIEAALLEDPWIESAVVDVRWPGGIDVSITEYTAYATVVAASGWVHVAGDGSVLAVAEPLTGAPLIDIDTGPVSAGYEIANPLIIGALTFVQGLDPDIGEAVVVTSDGEGLIASVGGYTVVLGRPIEMTEKAIVLATLLETGLEPGSSINLIAPLRPAVTNPQPLPEPEE